MWTHYLQNLIVTVCDLITCTHMDQFTGNRIHPHGLHQSLGSQDLLCCSRWGGRISWWVLRSGPSGSGWGSTQRSQGSLRNWMHRWQTRCLEEHKKYMGMEMKHIPLRNLSNLTIQITITIQIQIWALSLVLNRLATNVKEYTPNLLRCNSLPCLLGGH